MKKMAEKKTNILIVDDDNDICYLSSQLLSQKGYTIDTANDGESALVKVKERPFDIIITDLRMPKMDGMQLLSIIKKSYPSIEVIIITGYGSVSLADEASKKGAFGFLSKPFDWDTLLAELSKAKKVMRIKREVLPAKAEANYFSTKDFIAIGTQIKQLDEKINDIAASNASVLISGESGTGKEIIAHQIHYRSKRSKKPFVRVSCAALTESILESELFGHEKGAFTGAIAERKGRFELADKGTLFLDEIGDMPLTTQVKFLRVLQERDFERVGGTRTIKVDIRILAATHKNLKEEVKKGHFRNDLFYRINVIPITIAPLRERKGDIPELVSYFTEKFRLELNKNCFTLTDKAMEKLITYSWPGNIRELENLMERIVVTSPNNRGGENIIDLEDLPAELSEKKRGHNFHYNLPFKEAKREMIKMYLVNSLERYHWNVSETAARIGLNRVSLIKNINKLGIREKYMNKGSKGRGQ